MQLDELEKLSRTLDLSFNEDLTMASQFAKNFLESRANAEAYRPKPESFLVEEELLKISQDPTSMSEVIEIFERVALGSGIQPTSGKFMGYIPGGGVPTASIGDFLAALTNRYSGVFEASPGATLIENEMVRWFIDQVSLPEQTAWGTLTSGGTMAILLCLIAARAELDPSLWSKSVIYFSKETHHCLQRSLIVSGLGQVHQRVIDCDENYRINTDLLEQKIQEDRSKGLNPWLLVGNSGTVNTGAIDPLDTLSQIAGQNDLWFHVDACYGGGFALLPEMKKLFRGIDKADSIALDPHKGFFQPYGLGTCLVRDGSKLKSELAYTADYLKDVENSEVPSPADYSLELTRPFRGLRFWMALKRHGLKVFQAAQLEKKYLADYLYRELQLVSGIELGPEPQLSIVSFRTNSSSDQKELLDHLIRQKFHVSSTRLGGQTYLRACVLGFRTHKSDIDQLITEIKAFA